MPNSSNNFKWSVILVIFIGLIWFYFKACHGSIKPEVVKVTYDTTYLKQTDTIRIPYQTLVPYKVVYTKEKVLHDTLETVELEKVDTARILAQYFATRFYSKTDNVQYGNVTVKDTVTQNRIIGRSIILNQNIPVVKETVTLTQPKRIVLLAGVQAFGNKQYLPYAAGITLDLKLKSDAMIGGGAYLTRSDFMYSADVKFPIRFRKQ